jgi:hypothetical protein
MKVNGLELPDGLKISINNGVWMSRGDQYSSRWSDKNHIALFKKHFPLIEDPLPQFFDFDGMVSANALWTGPQDAIDFYSGIPSTENPPGSVDPRYTVIIGASEPDSPIALDYRATTPKVVYFCDVGDIAIWVDVFDNVESMMDALEMFTNGSSDNSIST